MAGPAAANDIQHLCCVFRDPVATSVIQRLYYHFRQPGFGARAAVASLQQLIRPGPVLVICDEFDHRHDGYIPWLTEVHDRLPAITVWTAGVRRVDRSHMHPLLSWLQLEPLQEAMRCPLSVTEMLQQSLSIQLNSIPQYTAPQVAVATQGPAVQRLQHRGQPDHGDGRPEQCVTCADGVADIIHQLGVGQPGQPLQYRDVWILYVGGPTPRADDVLVRGLQQRGLPVAVASYPPSEDEARELALAVSDQIVVTHFNAIHGLERRVVVVLGSLAGFESWSRSSSSLYTID